jgi:hypothetical protein
VCDGVCIDPKSDSQNCGGCGQVCPRNQNCVARTCSCGPPYTLCSPDCVNLQESHANCGVCGLACGPTQTCVAGTCTP